MLTLVNKIFNKKYYNLKILKSTKLKKTYDKKYKIIKFL